MMFFVAHFTDFLYLVNVRVEYVVGLIRLGLSFDFVYTLPMFERHSKNY
jgi:hypothetical protein